MSTQVDTALSDGQGSPVSHAFVAMGVDGKGVAKWYEKTTSSIAAGFFTLTSSMRIGSKVTDPIRFEGKLVVPTVVVETINGVNYNKVSRQMLVTISVIVPQDSTTQERKDLMRYVKQFCDWTSGGTAAQKMQLGAQVVDLDPPV